MISKRRFPPPASRSAHPGEAESASPDSPDDSPMQPGVKPVLELLDRDPAKVDTVFVLKGRRNAETDAVLDRCRERGVRFRLVDAAFLDRLWSGRHQGVLARLLTTGFSDLDTVLEATLDSPLPLILALDQVQDPGNAGTMARTLYAFGGGGLIIPRHNGVYLGAAAAKASAGALDRLPVCKAANLGQALDEARKQGFTIYGAASLPVDPQADTAAYVDLFHCTPRLPAVLVLGSEDTGMRPTIAKRCDQLIHIPFARNFDSLNVAQAGAIIMARFAGIHGMGREAK